VQHERASLEHGAEVIVGTPGRVHDDLVRERLDLSRPCARSRKGVPVDHQTLLFSATFRRRCVRWPTRTSAQRCTSRSLRPATSSAR
jgi:superfamily II DNA/RNA helicase